MSTPTQLIHTDFVRGQAVPAGGIDLRSGTFANPFPCGTHGVSLAQAQRYFAWWLAPGNRGELSVLSAGDSAFMFNAIDTLRGKTLYCDCAARHNLAGLCHGEILLRVVERAHGAFSEMATEKPPDPPSFRFHRLTNLKATEAMECLGQTEAIRVLNHLLTMTPAEGGRTEVGGIIFHGLNFAGTAGAAVEDGRLEYRAFIVTGLAKSRRKATDTALTLQSRILF